jgi:putative transposase
VRGSGPSESESPGRWCRSVTYRLSPTARQARALGELLAYQRELYNAALEERRGAWRWERRRITRFEQFRELTGSGAVLPWLGRFGIGVARGTLVRLDEAFAHFFRRHRAGERPGFPRFRGEGSWDSVQWGDTNGWKLTRTGKGTYGRLYVQGVGHLKVKLHRWFGDGAEPRKLVVRRRARRWEATVSWRGVAIEPLPRTGRACGVDVGVAVLAAVAADDGSVELVANPEALGRKRAALARAQQALAACQRTGRRDGGRRERARAQVARLHERIRAHRKNCAHQLSARLVAAFDVIAIEDLHVPAMTRSARGTVDEPGRCVGAKAGLNRSILDAGWGQLARLLAYKAASAGRELVRVPAPGTSQTCADCGHQDQENRVDRDHFSCVACGHEDHADANAAVVILAAAQSRPEPGHQPVTAGRDTAPWAVDREAHAGDCTKPRRLLGSGHGGVEAVGGADFPANTGGAR